MRLPFCLLVLLGSVFVCCALHAPLFADDTRAAASALGGDLAQPPSGVLLLKNGRTLTGAITRDPSGYVFHREGGQIRIPDADVELSCGSLEQVFQYKLHRLNQRDPDEHLDLARWCLEHRLPRQALEELLIVRTLDPKNAEAERMLRRLERTHRSENELTGSPQPPRPGAARQPEPPPPDRRWAAESMRLFTSRVQPVLIKRCATAGCHGPDHPGEFRLTRYRASQPSPRLTQLNWHAVISAVNSDQPEESPLLLKPLGPHMRDGRPVFFNRDDPGYQTLLSWVRGLRTAGDSPADDRAKNAPPSSLPSRAPGTPFDPARLPADASGPTPLGPLPTSSPATAAAPPPGATPARAPASAEPSADASKAPRAPLDPFDPTLFNRKRKPPAR